MRIALITDAWHPQVNGVVRTLTHMKREITAIGHEMLYITPDQFPNLPCPFYPEIRLAWGNLHRVGSALRRFRPDAIHISTEGPLGMTARQFCLSKGFPFTTAYHTRFPEYVEATAYVPQSWTYQFMRWFHQPSRSIMVPTPSMQQELEARGFERIRQWTRGVESELFHPQDKMQLAPYLPPQMQNLPRPIFLYVGRVSVEKNIKAFLDLRLPGSKVVVGDGPQRAVLAEEHPDVLFAGTKHGAELARYYAFADVFVFPSLTDTFGNVMLEALACGLPVAAYPVTGPKDVIGTVPVGVLHNDLNTAAQEALKIDPAVCRAFATRMSWPASACAFLSNLAPFGRLTKPVPA